MLNILLIDFKFLHINQTMELF